MKKLLVGLCAIFICTFAIANTIEWYVDGSLYQTTTCDAGDNITPPTAPAKYGYDFVKWFGYAQLEYIESTGTQYIDTGYAPTSNTNSMKAQIKLSYLSYKTIQDKNPFVFGSSTLIDSLRRYNRIGLVNNNFVYTITTGSSSEVNTDVSPVLGTVYDTEYSINFGTSASLKILNGSTLVVNDTQTGNMQRSTESYYLFAINHNVAVDGVRETIGRMYSCKIYDNDTLVRDFIPARRTSDNAVGMYDTVSETFFTNSGTGEFIAGPVVGAL